MPEGVRWTPGSLIGVAAPGLFLLVVSTLTWYQRSFLDSVGWSPVHRSPVEWPSLLALGPGGWVLVATFLGMALAAATLAWTYRHTHPGRHGTGVAGAMAVVSAGLALVAFKADLPTAITESWHAAIHNRGYLLIPTGGVIAMALTAVAAPNRGLRSCSRALLAPTALAFAATNADPIAQLARYFAFLGLLVYVAAIGIALRERSSGQT